MPTCMCIAMCLVLWQIQEYVPFLQAILVIREIGIHGNNTAEYHINYRGDTHFTVSMLIRFITQ